MICFETYAILNYLPLFYEFTPLFFSCKYINFILLKKLIMITCKNTIPEHAPPDENPGLLSMKEQTLRMVN